jgi:hypothetical protein
MSSAFVSRAMPDASPAGGVVIAMAENFRTASSQPRHRHFDICPVWLELAVRHLSDAQVARRARIAAWQGTDEGSRSDALEWEFEASMQASMAAAVAVDAFCVAVENRVRPPQSLVDHWREMSVPRAVQIADILRIAFSLTARQASNLRQNLGEIFRFRDLSIDPSTRGDAPILHPELRVAVEWRFAFFQCENALLIVGAAMQLVRELAASGKPKDAGLQSYVDALRPALERLQNSNALKAQAPGSGARRGGMTPRGAQSAAPPAPAVDEVTPQGAAAGCTRSPRSSVRPD